MNDRSYKLLTITVTDCISDWGVPDADQEAGCQKTQEDGGTETAEISLRSVSGIVLLWELIFCPVQAQVPTPNTLIHTP